jgi:hypothetical protein
VGTRPRAHGDGGAKSAPEPIFATLKPRDLAADLDCCDCGAPAYTREGRSPRAREQLLKSLLHAFGIPGRVR